VSLNRSSLPSLNLHASTLCLGLLVLALCIPAPAAAAEPKKSTPAAVPIATTSVIPPATPFNPATALDRNTCYSLALRRSETLAIQESETRAAEARYWQAVGAILPQVSANATQQWQNAPDNTGASGGAFGSGGSDRTDQFEGRLTLTQTIFNGFRNTNLIGARDAEKMASSYTAIRFRQLLYLDVSDVFYQILSQERDLEILRQLDAALATRIDDLQHRVSIGRSRRGDLLQAQSQQADTLVTIEQVKGLLGASKELMAFLLGLPSEQIHLIEKNPFPAPANIEAYLRATGERPDVTAQIQQSRAAERNVSIAKGEHAPTVDLETNWFAVQDPGSSRDWNVFLTVSLPLFDGGIIDNRVKEQKENLRQAQLDLERLRRQADSDVRTAYINFIASAAQFIRLGESTRITKESYQVQRRDYELGRASNLDVLIALANYQEAERRLAGSEMQARANLAQLEVASGTVGEKKP
jgi:outer membrane protein